MLTAREIADAGNYVERLRQSVHDISVPNTNRVRAAGACLAVAQEHHHAIIRLISERLYSSAFALVRATFEAYVRGEWLALCAKEGAIKRFLKGRSLPQIDALLGELERTPAFDENVLSSIKRRSWNAMCDYAHTGGRQAQRWNTAEGIEPNFARDEVLEAIRFSESVATLSVVGLARIAGSDGLAVNTLEIYKERMRQ